MVLGADANRQRETVENSDAALDDRRIGQFKERRPSLQPQASSPQPQAPSP